MDGVLGESPYEPRAGDTVAGRYRLEHEIGRGGMGEVWAAYHVALNVPCAVKFIIGRGSREHALVARFAREAQAAARLRTPHVVQILDTGIWQGAPYIAMERLEGEPMSELLERRGALTPGETLAILRDIAEALSVARHHGVVHRDLKPENVFLVPNGSRTSAKVLDFGIARLTGSDNATWQTTPGEVIGTPAYMSPEQIEGGDIDHRSDLWALAIMAFECMTGRPPFESDSYASMFKQILLAPLPRPSDHAAHLPDAVDSWWHTAAARDPELRFQTADALCDALAAAFDRSDCSERPTELCQSATTARATTETLSGQSHGGGVSRRARPWIAGLAALIALAIVILSLRLPERPAAATAEASVASNPSRSLRQLASAAPVRPSAEAVAPSVAASAPVRAAAPRPVASTPAPSAERASEPAVPPWTRDPSLPPDDPGF